MTGRQIAESLSRCISGLLVKVATRAVLWFCVSLLGMQAAAAEGPAGQAGFGIGAAAAAILAWRIDRWHHRRDLAQEPPPE